jgi:hypothetical protein
MILTGESRSNGRENCQCHCVHFIPHGLGSNWGLRDKSGRFVNYEIGGLKWRKLGRFCLRYQPEGQRGTMRVFGFSKEIRTWTLPWIPDRNFPACSDVMASVPGVGVTRT